MRPASEVNSALELVQSELVRREVAASLTADDDRGMANLRIAYDVLAWVMGEHWTALTDGQNPWLAAFLLDDPPKIDNTPPEVN